MVNKKYSQIGFFWGSWIWKIFILWPSTNFNSFVYVLLTSGCERSWRLQCSMGHLDCATSAMALVVFLPRLLASIMTFWPWIFVTIFTPSPIQFELKLLSTVLYLCNSRYYWKGILNSIGKKEDQPQCTNHYILLPMVPPWFKRPNKKNFFGIQNSWYFGTTSHTRRWCWWSRW